MHRQKPISSTQEMYLKVLHEVRGDHGVARVRDLAKGLGVSSGTVTGVLKTLERMQLVEHERYGVVALTDQGEGVAECVLRRYDVLKAVLIEVFGVEEDVAAVDACMMEHAASAATINRMAALLNRVRRRKLALAKGLRTEEGLCPACKESGVCMAVGEDAD